jgi:hypothetical protein
MHLCFKIENFYYNLCRSINRTVLEDATNTKSHGNQRLHVQWWKAPDDGHNNVRNMYSDIDCNKNFTILKQRCI